MPPDKTMDRQVERRPWKSAFWGLARQVLKSAVVGIFAALILGSFLGHTALIGAVVGVVHMASERFLEHVFAD